MASFTIEHFDAIARRKIPENHAATPNADRLIFVGQYYVPRDKASGVKLRVGVLVDENGGKEMVWALMVFAEGVEFYKESGMRLPVTGLKQVRFDEPMRTLAGSLKDHRAPVLRSHIAPWFMDKRALEEFQKTKFTTFKHYKSGCKRSPRRSARAGTTSEIAASLEKSLKVKKRRTMRVMSPKVTACMTVKARKVRHHDPEHSERITNVFNSEADPGLQQELEALRQEHESLKTAHAAFQVQNQEQAFTIGAFTTFCQYLHDHCRIFSTRLDIWGCDFEDILDTS